MTDVNPDVQISQGGRQEGVDRGPSQDFDQSLLKELGELVGEFFPEGMSGVKKEEKTKLEEGLTKLIKKHEGDPTKISAGEVLDEIINAGLPQLPPPKLSSFENLLEELAIGDIGERGARSGATESNGEVDRGGIAGFIEAARNSGAAKWLSTSYMAVMLEVILDNIDIQKEIKLSEGLHESEMIEKIAQNVVAVTDMIMEVAEKEADKHIIQRNASIAKAAIGFAGVANTVASPVASKITSKVKGMADKQMTRARHNVEQKYANYQYNKGQRLVQSGASQSQIDRGYKLMEKNYAKAGRADDFQTQGLSQQQHYRNDKFSNENYVNNLERRDQFNSDVDKASQNRAEGNEKFNQNVVEDTPPGRDMPVNQKIEHNQRKLEKAEANSAETDQKISKEQKQLAALQKARHETDPSDMSKRKELKNKIDTSKEKITDLKKDKQDYDKKIDERRGNIDRLTAYGGNDAQIERRQGDIDGDIRASEPGMSQIDDFKRSDRFKNHLLEKTDGMDDSQTQKVFDRENANLDAIAQRRAEQGKRWEADVDQEQKQVEQGRKDELRQIDANSSQREMEDLRMIQELNRQSTEGINSVIDATMYHQLAEAETALGEARVGEQAAQAVLQTDRTERERTHESKRAASEQINDLVQGYKSFIQTYHQAMGFGKSFTT